MDPTLSLETARPFQPLPGKPRPMSDPEEAMRFAQDFEAVFIADALKHMVADIGNDPIAGGGTGSQNWRELLMDEYAHALVRKGGIGLAEPMARDLLKVQETYGS